MCREGGEDRGAGAARVAASAARYGPTEKNEGMGPGPATPERDLVFAGVVGMIDPPRPEARAAVAEVRRPESGLS
jgi:Cation transport ATPase